MTNRQELFTVLASLSLALAAGAIHLVRWINWQATGKDIRARP